MAPKSTSTHRRATSPSAGSPSSSSTDSSQETLEIPNPEAAAPAPPDQEAPVSSPEPALSEAAAAAVALITTEGADAAIAGQLRIVVEAIDAYARGTGPWDDVVLQVAAAKAILGLSGG